MSLIEHSTLDDQSRMHDMMLRLCGILVLIFSLSACQKLTHSRTPRYQHDACRLINFDPSWRIALQQTHNKWGVSYGLILAFIKMESSFRAHARPSNRYILGFIRVGRRSSAYGYAQVIDQTWQWYQQATNQPQARRDRFHDAVDFIGWYVNKTSKVTEIKKSDVFHQYLAYNQGHRGFLKGTYKHNKKLLNFARRTHRQAVTFNRQLKRCLNTHL